MVYSLQENCFHLIVIGREVHHILQSVVRYVTAHGSEECHTLFQSILQCCKAADFCHAADSCQLIQIIQIVGLFNVHGLIGSPCGEHLYVKALVLGNFLMPLQRIHRVVGGANQSNVALFNQVTDAHGRLCQLFVAELPNLIRGLAAQNTRIAKISLQLQMAPVEQGIADCFAQALCPFTEFFIVGSVSCNVFFLYAAGAHETPFIMVAAQPDLSDILKLTILSDFPGVNVAVVVKYRCVLCIVVEQLLRCFGFQQKVFVHKCFHFISLRLILN